MMSFKVKAIPDTESLFQTKTVAAIRTVRSHLKDVIYQAAPMLIRS